MTLDTTKLNLGDDPLVRFDLRAQFAMNRIMREIGLMAAKELHAFGDPTIAPYSYSRQSRSFQSFAAHKTALANLTDSQQKERLNSLKSLLASIERSKWDDYFAVVDEYYDDDKLNHDAWRHKYGSLSYVSWLNLYFRYGANRRALLNGVLWDHLCRSTSDEGEPVPALGALLVEKEKSSDEDRPTQTSHWAYRVHFHGTELVHLGNKVRQTMSASQGDLTIHSELVKIFAFDGDQPRGTLTHVLLVPVYDYYIAGEPWGGLAATLQIPLTLGSSIEDHEKTVVALVNKLQSSVEIVALVLAASGMQRIAAEPTGFPLSLAFEWIRGLQYLQDWEKIRIERPDRRPLIWTRRECDHEGTEVSGGLYARLIHGQHDEPPTPSGETAPIIQFVRSRGGHDDGGEKLIGDPVDIGDAMRFDDRTERGRSPNVQGVGRITFSFPPHFRLPSPESSDSELMSRVLCDVLVRQQKEVLQALSSKVAARRAAVRTAVSAIMGRNLSHNIGSHVLARYGSEIRNHAYPTVENAIDPRTEFLAYLQRRMDFLAEVATADQAFWARSISLKDALARLDIEKEADLYRGKNALTGAETARTPILLSYITGKDLPATVKWGSPGGGDFPDQTFACPSGEVGIHALYVILENIIRNSARHAPTVGEGGSEQPVAVYVVPGLSVVRGTSGSDKSPVDLLEIQLVDPRSRWGPSNDGDGEKVLATINQILRANGDGDDHVHSEAHLLDAQGEVNPKNWGVREMQICAQFLRGLSLSELEGERADPPVLKAIPYPLGARTRCLAYQLWLERPRDVAVVYPEAADITCADDASGRGIRHLPVAVTQDHRINWAPIVDEATKYGIVAVAQDLVDGLETWIGEGTSASSDAGAPAEPVSRRHRMPMRWVGADKEVLEGFAGSDSNRRYCALARLHLAVARKYLMNGYAKKSWLGDEPINILYAIGASDAEADSPARLAQSDGCGETIRFTTVGINVLRRPERILHDQYLPWLLKPLPRSKDKGIAFAWIDHASGPDLNMDEGPQFKYASLPYHDSKRRSIWVSAESSRSASAHCEVLRRVKETMTITPAFNADLSELISAATARVVVLDERIQKSSCDKPASVTLHRAWANSGIWCPRSPADFRNAYGSKEQRDPMFSSHDPALACDLNSPDFEKLRAYLMAPTLLSQQLPADVLVIHLTILERITKDRPRSIGKDCSEGEVLKELVCDTSCDTAQVVVVTGRGVPAAAWKRDGGIDARYLPISAIQEYLVSRPSKLGLMRVLWAARAPH